MTPEEEEKDDGRDDEDAEENNHREIQKDEVVRVQLSTFEGHG